MLDYQIATNETNKMRAKIFDALLTDYQITAFWHFCTCLPF